MGENSKFDFLRKLWSRLASIHDDYVLAIFTGLVLLLLALIGWDFLTEL